MLLMRILTAFVAVGVIVAGVVLWRVARHTRARWIVVTATAYGAAALLHAVLTGLPVRDALAGHGLFQGLPRLLQGAFVGGFVILPLGWIVAIVRAGIPRFRDGSPRRTTYRAVALTTCVGIVIVSLPRAGDTTSAVSSAQSIAAPFESLDKSLRAIADGERESAKDRWDLDFVVGQIGRDSHMIVEWVRDNTFWIPYRGVLRGPEGVLLDRQGNSLDRALLLAALLQKAGVEVRLAHGRLTRDEALALLPELANRRSLLLPVSTEVDDGARVQDVAARYQLNPTSVARSVEGYAQTIRTTYGELDDRVADQAARLLAAVGSHDPMAGWPVRLEEAVEALSDHWWVQQREGQAWEDVDLMNRSGPRSAALETVNIDDLPAGLHHEVVVRVLAEQWSNGTVKEGVVLEHVLRPSHLLGDSIVLQFWPGAWPSVIQSDPNSKLGIRGVALEQSDWIALLRVGQTAVADGLIHADGAVRHAAEGNPFAGLAGAFQRQLDGPSNAVSTGELTAVWIEYEIRAPDTPSRTIRRVVFDLLGPSARAARVVPGPALDETSRLARSLALMTRTEILPLVSEMAPEFVTHLIARNMLDDRELFGAIQHGATLDADQGLKLTAVAPAPVSPLYALAVMRRAGGEDHVIVDRLNVLTRHQRPACINGAFTMQDAIDIVANEVGVDLDEVDAFGTRVMQGVRDTNAEALIAPTRGITNTGEAFKASRDWIAISADHPTEFAMPSDARARAALDLAAGNTIVAPRHSISTGGGEFIGWWRIDRATGSTLGMSADGWGSAGFNYALVLKSVATFASSFAFEYGMCQAMPAGIATVSYWGGRVRNGNPLGEVPDGTQSVISQSVHQNNMTCLISAMVAGCLVTLPLVILTVKYSRIPRRLASIEANAVSAERRVASGAGHPPVPQPGGSATEEVFAEAIKKGPYRGGDTRLTAPPGKGPFTRDNIANVIRSDPEHPLAQILGKPEWYEEANRHAVEAYSRARAQGWSDPIARQVSYEVNQAYIKAVKGRVYQFGGLSELPSGKQTSTVGLILGTALLSFIPAQHFADRPK